MRWTVAFLPVAVLLGSCGTGIYVPDAGAYVSNPFRDFNARRALSVQQEWDTALAPLSCKMFSMKGKTWFIDGSVVANGILFQDGAIFDPAFPAAYGRKTARHIGPDC